MYIGTYYIIYYYIRTVIVRRPLRYYTVLLLFVSNDPIIHTHSLSLSAYYRIDIMGVRECDIVCAIDLYIYIYTRSIYLYNIPYTRYLLYNNIIIRTWEPHQYALKSPSLAYYALRGPETIARARHTPSIARRRRLLERTKRKNKKK